MEDPRIIVRRSTLVALAESIEPDSNANAVRDALLVIADDWPRVGESEHLKLNVVPSPAKSAAA